MTHITVDVDETARVGTIWTVVSWARLDDNTMRATLRRAQDIEALVLADHAREMDARYVGIIPADPKKSGVQMMTFTSLRREYADLKEKQHISGMVLPEFDLWAAARFIGAALESATFVERERCAMLAECFNCDMGCSTMRLAEKIRSGGSWGDDTVTHGNPAKIMDKIEVTKEFRDAIAVLRSSADAHAKLGYRASDIFRVKDDLLFTSGTGDIVVTLEPTERFAELMRTT
jgi:hypothetical protein